MESAKKRSPWIMVLVVAAVATATILLVPWDAAAVTGNPTLTLSLLKNTPTSTTRTITGSGTYSDPDGVCVVGPGVVVTYTIRTGSATGPIVDSGTTPTDANGNYSFTSISFPKNSGTYFVTVSVTGSLAGGYGVGDVCPNTSTTSSIGL